MSNSSPFRVAIIGGGISGLSAAFWLREQCPNATITVFEKRDRLGGVLHTELRDNFEIEQSADNFITTVPYGLDLCRRLGLDSKLVTTTPRHRQTFILWHNRLHKLPDGFMMMAPTKWWPMAVTRLLSPLGKLRAALEFFIPAKKDDADESMESFAVRRLGRQVFDRLIEPLVSGVYAADMKRLSLLATLPRFREMEKKHGSLIRAMRANRSAMNREAKKARKANQKRQENAGSTTSEPVQSGPRYNLFVTLKGGLSQIVTAIENHLNPNEIHCSTEVTTMTPLANGGWKLRWRPADTKTSSETNSGSCTETNSGNCAGTNSEESSADFDAVILAAESHNIAKLLESASVHRAAELLAGIEHTGTVVLTAAFRREDVGHPLDGMGAVVPSVEKNPILALSFSNEKYPHRAPEGTVLLRIFSGGARNPEIVTLPEADISKILLENVQSCLQIHGEPILTSLSCWPNTMPQFHLGHLERVAELEKEMTSFPTLAIAGNSLTGVGIPHCIHSGEVAAQKVLDSLKTR